MQPDTDDEVGTVRFPVVCLGASAGGLEALSDFFDVLPTPTGAAYVVVVHLSPDFKSHMPDLLARRTPMPVTTAEEGTVLEPDRVYVIPANKTMRMDGEQLRLTARDRESQQLNLPIDIFLRSLAETAGQNGVAIILSGTGSDGSRGAQAVKEHGGLVMIQTPNLSKFNGMPLATRTSVSVDAEGTPGELAAELARFFSEPAPRVPAAESEQQATLRRVFTLLATDGPDLSFLRAPMVLRRMRRRMQLKAVSEVEDYVERLEVSDKERASLRADLLINVTQFFREPAALEALREQVLPALLAAEEIEPLRVWVAGCATGQEAYTLAMLIEETMASMGVQRDYKVFATDLDREALEQASRGKYSVNEAADIPDGLTARYFLAAEGRIVIRKSIRQRVIFAAHNLVTDPPFVRMDLVCCRNVLIYLRPELQEVVLSGFYHALLPDRGVLLLGAAEAVGTMRDSFDPIHGRVHLYRRGESPPRRAAPRGPSEPQHAVSTPENSGDLTPDVVRLALESAFEAEDSSAAIVTRRGLLRDVVCDPRRIFTLAKGPPTQDVTRLLESTVASGLLRALAELETKKSTAKVFVTTTDGPVRLIVRPLRDPDHLLLIVKQLHEEKVEPRPAEIASGSQEYIDSLNLELQRTKHTLQATIEELQSANEEQQATNEELVASNEELQSTNEELHSVNEELYTVNNELQHRNEDLEIATSDLDNLLRHTAVATVYLDERLCVRRVNGAINRLLPIRSHDVGRPLGDFVHRLDIDLVEVARRTAAEGDTQELEVRDHSGAWQLLRATPYEFEGRRRGVLLTLIDVTRLKNAEAAGRAVNEQLAAANASLREQAEQLEDMFSIISHDLKRPLLSITGMVELGLEDLPANSSSRGFLESALQSTTKLRTIFEELVSLTKATRIDLPTTTVELEPWLRELMVPFQPTADAAGVSLVWLVDGDRAEFATAAATTILTNLVENALRHGSSGENPRIEVLVQATNTMRVVVSDNGRGISPEDHPRVFELFRRLDEDVEGTGVGLVAVRRLASRAGGRVDLQSSPGKGARFIVELPLGGEREATSRGYPILAVEDDPVDAKQVRYALSDHAVTVAVTIAAAAQHCGERKFALIVLDLSLPDGHGLELLSRIQMGPNRDTPVIILSGHDAGLENIVLPSQVVATHNKDVLDGQSLRQAVGLRLDSR